MSVRKVTHIGKNIIGKFPSLKMDRMISFESSIERDYVYILEFESGVVGFEEQPLTIEYVAGQKLRRYTPDFKVETETGTRLVECKPEAQVDESRNQVKFAAAEDWSREQGWTFEVVTDRDLREGYYLPNVRTLVHQARRLVRSDLLHTCQRVLSVQPRTLLELMQRIDPDHLAAVQAELLCLAFYHLLRVDMTSTLIGNNTLVYLPGDEA